MSRLWITGYRNYELGIFNEKGPKVDVLKFMLTKEITAAIEDGVNWIITGGQLGIEQLTAEVAIELKKQFPNEFQIAMMFPFRNFGNQWNEINKSKLENLKANVDFIGEVSSSEYNNPQQLRNYQEFMLLHTDLAVLIYDLEHEGKTKYDYDAILRFEDTHPYEYKMITFEDLQEFANEYQENLNSDSN